VPELRLELAPELWSAEFLREEFEQGPAESELKRELELEPELEPVLEPDWGA
jgi:hypothetical protein